MNNLRNKQVMADNLKFYISKQGISRGDLAAALDFPYTTVCDWFNGITYPRIDKIEMIANYFGIDKSDLIEKREDKSQYYINENTTELVEELHKRPELKVLFDTLRNVKREDIEFVKNFLEKITKQ